MPVFRATFCLLVAVWLALAAQPALALTGADDIDWDAPPAAFVTSLYAAVFERPPEARSVVASWVERITDAPDSRRQVFLDMVGSADYRARHGDIEGTWRVYPSTGSSPAHTAAEAAPAGHGDPVDGPYREAIARALVSYHDAFATTTASAPAPQPAPARPVNAAQACTAADVAGSYSASWGPIKCERTGERELQCCYSSRCRWRLDLTIAEDGRSVAGLWDHLDGRTGPAAFPLDESCALASGEYGYKPGQLGHGWPVTGRIEN